MGDDKKKVTISFVIEPILGYDCMGGSSFSDCCDFEVDFTEEEIETMRSLVAASEHDSETNLMLILEDKAPELFQRIDEKAREAMTVFFWLEAVHSGEGVDTDYGDLFFENYQRDLESGDFVPSDDYEPEDDYDEDEDLSYIEWYEREQERMSYEDAQWFRNRYHENFDGVDVSGDEYICYIPEELV